MMEDNQMKNRPKEDLSHLSKVMIIGFIGGVFWSFIGLFAHYLNFTELGPSLILEPWAIGDWKYGPRGQFIGIIAIGIISIGVAVLYNAIFKSTKNIWPSTLFGLVLWGIVFYLLNPIFPNLESINDFSRNTVITTISLYILYGVFVGYSISFNKEEIRHI